MEVYVRVFDSVQCLSQSEQDQCTLPHAGVHWCRDCSAHIGGWFQDPCTFIIVNHQHSITLALSLERYWHWVIGHWAIFTDCYWGIFFNVVTPNTIPIRQQSAPSTSCHLWCSRCQQMTVGKS